MLGDQVDDGYDELLGQLYDGILEARPFDTFMRALRQQLDVYLVSLTLRPPAEGDRGVIVNVLRPGNNTPAIASHDDWGAMAYTEQFFSLDPFVNLPPGEVITLADLIPERELLASDYYQQYLEPIDIFHIIGVDTVAPDGLLARFRLARSRNETPFSDKERRALERLTPHLRRAINLHTQLNRTRSERDLYADAVEQLSLASFILDEQGRLLNCNALAQQLLSDETGLALHQQRLKINGVNANTALQETINDVITAQINGETSMVKALRLPRIGGEADLGIVIRPVPVGQWTEGQSSPCVAVFISNPDWDTAASQQTLAELFGLSPAEANIAVLLSRGLSLAEVSETQHISLHTARAQLKSIFSKTGVSRQAELVRLVLKSVANLA